MVHMEERLMKRGTYAGTRRLRCAFTRVQSTPREIAGTLREGGGNAEWAKSSSKCRVFPSAGDGRKRRPHTRRNGVTR